MPGARDHLITYDPVAWQAAVSGATLAADQRALRDAFVHQYVIDFNGAKALCRAGCPDGNIKSVRAKASQLLGEPYVAVRIAEAIKNMRETDIVSRNQVLARVWEECNDYGNEGSTRVKALMLMAKMLGMLKELVVDAPATPQNVMLVPLMSADQWEAAASTAQLELKARAIAPAMSCPPPPPPKFTHGTS